jgi:hypothetical protein
MIRKDRKRCLTSLIKKYKLKLYWDVMSYLSDYQIF